MLKRILLAGICLSSVLLAIPAQAQPGAPATLIMRNGERISGDLVDLSVRMGFMIRVNGQERHINQNDVAAIELTGVRPLDDDLRGRLSAGRQLVVLRSGEVVEGRLIDIGGDYPKILTVETPSGNRDFSSMDVTQVYYAKPPEQAVATSGTAAPSTVLAPGAVRVNANVPWNDTGIAVRRGQRVTFNTTGQINYGQGGDMVANADGNDTLRGNHYPVPEMPVGGLIGKVGNSAPFAIGSNTQPVQMPANGTLMLGVNDTEHVDNSGFFSVVVTKVR